LRIGTRGSALALAQARAVADALRATGPHEVEVVPVVTAGDRVAGAGVVDDKSRFVKEIDEALLAGEVDLAVHSAKDVPGEIPDGLEIAAVPAAEDPRDALAGGAASLDELPAGARIGTSSLRRRSQLLALRPDLNVVELRGNVDTRLRKLAEGGYDAIVLALAGLVRLGRAAEAVPLGPEQLVPAAGQGALALEIRAGDARAASAVAPLDDPASRLRLECERALVSALDTSCRTPVGGHATVSGKGIRMHAYVGLPDGREWIVDRVEGDSADPRGVGALLAERMLSAGAGDLLARAESAVRG
jgi:hydroxymethylbilane synthase